MRLYQNVMFFAFYRRLGPLSVLERPLFCVEDNLLARDCQTSPLLFTLEQMYEQLWNIGQAHVKTVHAREAPHNNRFNNVGKEWRIAR